MARLRHFKRVLRMCKLCCSLLVRLEQARKHDRLSGWETSLHLNTAAAGGTAVADTRLTRSEQRRPLLSILRRRVTVTAPYSLSSTVQSWRTLELQA